MSRAKLVRRARPVTLVPWAWQDLPVPGESLDLPAHPALKANKGPLALRAPLVLQVHLVLWVQQARLVLPVPLGLLVRPDHQEPRVREVLQVRGGFPGRLVRRDPVDQPDHEESQDPPGHVALQRRSDHRGLKRRAQDKVHPENLHHKPLRARHHLRVRVDHPCRRKPEGLCFVSSSILRNHSAAPHTKGSTRPVRDAGGEALH